MIEMVSRDIIPAVSAYTGELASAAEVKSRLLPDKKVSLVERELVEQLSTLNQNSYALVDRLRAAERRAAKETDGEKMATAYRDSVIPLMGKLRATVDEMETLTASDRWPFPTYGEMMFTV